MLAMAVRAMRDGRSGGAEGDEMTLKPGPNWLKRGSNALKTAPNRVIFWAKHPHSHRNSIRDKGFRLCHERDTSKASPRSGVTADKVLQPPFEWSQGNGSNEH